jgi:hypothetical protein
MTADCAVGGALAAGGAVVVSRVANRLGERSVIEATVGTVELASKVLPVPPFGADDVAPEL